MNDDHLDASDLASVALGDTDPRVTAHLAACAACEERAARLDAALALPGAVTPPAAVLPALLDRLGAQAVQDVTEAAVKTTKGIDWKVDELPARPRRRRAWPVAFAAGALVSVAAVTALRLRVDAVERRHLTERQLIDVLVAARDVPPGKVFTAEDLEVAQFPTMLVDNLLRRSVITDRASILGCRTAEPIAAGQALQVYHFDRVVRVGTELVDYFVAARDVPAGEVFELNDLAVAPFPLRFVQGALGGSVIMDRATILGCRTAEPIAAGQLLQTYHFEREQRRR